MHGVKCNVVVSGVRSIIWITLKREVFTNIKIRFVSDSKVLLILYESQSFNVVRASRRCLEERYTKYIVYCRSKITAA